jgi:O-succinylbenzoic acid--CoA ligase
MASVKWPDSIACRTDAGDITFSQLEAQVAVAASVLVRRGTRAGDRVALLLPNSLSAVSLMLAAPRIGASTVPLNLRLTRKDWLHMCVQANCRLIVTEGSLSAELKDTDFPEFMVADLAFEIGDSSQSGAKSPPIQLDAAAEANVMFTSGSSGEAKGVILSNGNHYYNALGSNRNIILRPGDCWQLSLPLYHVGGAGIIYRTLLSGAAFYLTTKFDTQDTVALVDSGKISHLSLVPTMLNEVVAVWREDPSLRKPKAILLGGGAVSERLLGEIIELNLPVLTSYGLTETASQVCTMRQDDGQERLTTSGKPLPYRKVRIMRDAANIAQECEVGEIEVSGGVLFDGYLSDKSPFVFEDGERWFRTGDSGCLDTDGYLTVKGRLDEMIVSGGENIYPAEIIRAAEDHPDVKSAAVIAVADDRWGESPVLFVELDSGSSLASSELKSMLAERIARFKLPRTVITLESMPRTTIGKPDKTALMKLYCEVQAE